MSSSLIESGRSCAARSGRRTSSSRETGSTQDVLRDGDLPARRRRRGGAPDGRPGPLGPSLGRCRLRPHSSSPCCCGRRRRAAPAALPRGGARSRRGARAGEQVADAAEVAERRAERRAKGRRDPARGIRLHGRLRDRHQRQPGRGRPAAGNPAPATSLRIAARRPFDRGTVLATVLDELEGRYEDWLTGGLPSLAGELEARNALARQPRSRRRPHRHGGARSRPTAGSRSCSTGATGCSSRAARWSSIGAEGGPSEA